MPSITEYLSEPRIDSWPISTSYWLSESFSTKGSPRQKQGLFCKAVWCGFFPAFLSFSLIGFSGLWPLPMLATQTSPFCSGLPEGPIESGLVHWVPVETEVLAGES